MASVSRELAIESGAAEVWEVIGDFATGPSRMAPGFVVDTRAEAALRIVTFADGTVAREQLVCVDHDNRRIVYTVIGDSLLPAHDNASMQVIPDGTNRCRLVWIHDVLPDDLAPHLGTAMDHGLTVMKQTFEERAS